MSQDDDKNKSDGNSVVSAVSKPENDSTINKTNAAGPVSRLLNKPSTSNDWANNVKSQKTMPNIRENMVSKAAEFLTDGSIQQTPIERKVNFLRSKGLTDQEIAISLQRAATRWNQNSYTNNAPLLPLPANYNSSKINGVVQTPFQAQSWYRRLFKPIIFAATVAYIGYQIYKKYIENWLFGVRKPSVENRLEALELSMQKVLMLLEDKNNTFVTSNYGPDDQQRDHEQLRSELRTIKSLLLNKSQFPPAPIATSIPKWQLPKNFKLQVEQQNKINGADTPSNQNQVNGIYVPSTSKLNKSQFPPAPIDTSILEWQLPKDVKLQVEQQNKINGADTPSNQNQVNGIYVPSTSKQNKVNGIITPIKLPQSITNELNNGSAFDLHTSVIDSDNIINETDTSNDTPIETALPMISDQSIVKCDDVFAQSEHNENFNR